MSGLASGTPGAMRMVVRIVAGVLGLGLIYGAWDAFFHTPWKPPHQRTLFAIGALGFAFHFIAYAISSTYGKRRGTKAPTIRFKDPNV